MIYSWWTIRIAAKPLQLLQQNENCVSDDAVILIFQSNYSECKKTAEQRTGWSF